VCGDQQPRQRARQSWSGRRAAGARDRANQLEESGSGDAQVWGFYCGGGWYRGLAASAPFWVRGCGEGGGECGVFLCMWGVGGEVWGFLGF
jgi:uncharacterized membrane protein